MSEIQRWQRIAWAIGSHDLATDPVPEPGSPDDGTDAADFRDWAESTHGATARLALVIAEALQDTEPVVDPRACTDGDGEICFLTGPHTSRCYQSTDIDLAEHETREH